ncbi:MAG: tetratricopeptide repeat protein [Planctomycetota bacterium]
MRRLLTPLISLSFCALAAAQEGVPQPQGLVPEQMWYAPTAEDWNKPPLIRWQRTWDDAVRLSQQTKKPILVCVNMDGEIASEHYAGVRYRDPEVAKLFEPYVCVMASVYRHNPRDYDDQGRRIPCPRLGCVTCGEHIALEPLVYEKFLDGKRISPRHIMVELDGSEVYDVFYTWDVKSVLESLENGIKNRKIQAPPIVKGDRSLKERIESPDSADREAIEAEFAKASAELKKRMLELGIAAGDKVPLELLRQAAYGLDPDLARRAREGMQQSDDLLAVELIADTLRGPLAADERSGLVDALDRFRDRSTRARTLATAHRGLENGTSAIDGQKWQSVLVGPAYSGITDVAAEAQKRDQALARQPDDPQARLDVAESSLLQALEVEVARVRGGVRLAQAQRTLLLEDAKRHLDAAVAAGADGWRPKALEAVMRSQRGQQQRAFQLAAEAMPNLPPDAPGRLAKELLTLFAHGRQAAIQDAVRNKKEWPGAWTTDVHTAYTLLMKHPLGTPQNVADHYDFLEFFRSPDAEVVLQKGVERFPAAAPLHHRLRGLWLRQGGVARMEKEYAKLLAKDDAPAVLPWFAGYASLVAAEQHRRRSHPDDARASYNQALRHFASYRERTQSEDGAHYEAMAHGGLARLALQAGDLDLTFSELQQVFRIAPLAAAAVDGLSISAMQTAEALRGKALQDDPELVERLDAALLQLPDDAFLLPEYEQRNPGNPRYSRLRPRK